MEKMVVIAGAIGIACTVAAIVGMAISMMEKGNWWMVVGCLASLATILFLTLLGIEYSDNFWEGRS